MIKDFLVSFNENFKEKTRNPFLGTYLAVWLIRNWELIYTLFNFDSGDKLKVKIEFIKTYYSKNDFLFNLWTNVYWSFGLLILTYFLLNVSRLIVNLSEKRLTPWIYKITDSKSIVLKTEYNRIRNERDELQARLDQERESKSKLENRIKILETEIVEIGVQKDSYNTVKQTLQNESEQSKNSDLVVIYNKLKDNNLLKDFTDTSVMINKGEFINNNYKPKDRFVEFGLITFEKDHFRGDSKKYQLTTDGQEILRKIRIE